MTRRIRWTIAALALASAPLATGHAQDPGGSFPQGPRGFGPGGRGGPGPQERQIVSQFDKNNDTRLDTAERKAAREWLATQPSFGPGGRGRGGFGGRGMAAAAPGKKLAPSDVKSYPASTPLYDLSALRTVFLQFESADWEDELAAFYRTDVEVPATVIVDGKTYRDVGIHFRGSSSYFMVPQGSKRSLNLSFDFVHEDQALGGYRTLNLLNANSDPTFVRGVLFTEIARAYIPAPKMSYLRVVINGENWGVYLNAEQYNRDFVRDNFKTTAGARWKVPGSPGGRGGMEYLGPDVAPYKAIYEIKTKDDPKPWKDLIELFRVLNETPPEKLEAALAPMLDVDGALKFLALDVALVNSDGYWVRASDYNIYQDPKGRFHVLPHDVNEGLEEGGGPGRGRGGFGPPPPGGGPPPDLGGPGRGRGFGGGRGGGVDLDPLVGLSDPSKPLRSKLLAVPALKDRYLAYVKDIAEKWLDWKTVGPMVQGYQALIAEDVKADTKKLYSSEAFEADVAAGEGSLKSFLDKRRAFLLK